MQQSLRHHPSISVKGSLSFIFGAALFFALSIHAAMAQGAAPSPPPKIDSGDTAWMLTSSAFVLLMTPGLALFYAGMVRSKNVLSVLMQSFVACGLITVQCITSALTLQMPITEQQCPTRFTACSS
jgi:hypothetical protein